MRTTLAILSTNLTFLNAIIVHAIPASPPPSQLINPGSTPLAAAALSNGTANLTAPGVPYKYETCNIHPGAPLSDCLQALAQFPTGGDGLFHTYTPHDENADYSLGQVRKSGQCRIYVDLVRDARGQVTPTVWSWDGDGGLLNTIRSLLNTCTADQEVPVQQQVTAGVSILSLLQTIYPGFKILVMKTAELPEEEGRVDVT